MDALEQLLRRHGLIGAGKERSEDSRLDGQRRCNECWQVSAMIDQTLPQRVDARHLRRLRVHAIDRARALKRGVRYTAGIAERFIHFLAHIQLVLGKPIEVNVK